MKSEDKIIELFSETLLRNDRLLLRIDQILLNNEQLLLRNERMLEFMESTASFQERMIGKVDNLEKQQARTNVELSEMRLSFMQVADGLNITSEHEKRISRLEDKVFS